MPWGTAPKESVLGGGVISGRSLWHQTLMPWMAWALIIWAGVADPLHGAGSPGSW